MRNIDGSRVPLGETVEAIASDQIVYMSRVQDPNSFNVPPGFDEFAERMFPGIDLSPLIDEGEE